MILRNRGAKFFQTYGIWLLIGVPLTLLALPALIVVTLLDPDKLSAFLDEFLFDRDTLLTYVIPIALAIPLLWMAIQANVRTKLEITDSGIRYSSGSLDWIASFADWQLRWDQISSIKLLPILKQNPLLTPIVITTNGKTRKIIPWRWVDYGAPGESLFKTLRAVQGPKTALEVLRRTPVYVALRERGELEDAAEEKPKGASVSLRDASKAQILIAVAFVAAIFYFMLEGFALQEEFYVGAPPYPWLFVAGLLGAIAVWLALSNTGSQIWEAAVAAVLFGGGMALAAYPGLPRLNALFDQNGLQAYEYALGDNDTWRAAGAPDLVFDIGSDYWEQYTPGDTKFFEIRKGALGFYQINMAPVYADQRRFYNDKKLDLATE